MIIVLKRDADKKQINELKDRLKEFKVKTQTIEGSELTVMGLIGDTSKLDVELIQSLAFVDSVKKIQEPFKLANRKFHPDPTIVDCSGVKIGGGNFAIIAGPCSVESEEQILSVAKAVKECGADMLRGGAFKPRTSPYSFQGLKSEGIKLLIEAKKETGLPVVSEIMDASQLELFEDIDVLQVGARNMQNFDLLKELGKTKKPILLKRGLSAKIEELLMSAEYIMSEGNQNVILCERGIRTFETATRNTLDVSAVPVLREKTHLPVIIDPSHAVGISKYIPDMAVAAAATGCDGLEIEVHANPSRALSDGQQQLTPEAFKTTVERIGKIRRALK